jgi:hypothetical protein
MYGVDVRRLTDRPVRTVVAHPAAAGVGRLLLAGIRPLLLTLQRVHRRFAWAVPFVSLAGAFFCAGMVIRVFTLGGWPLHDTADFWLAGRHVLEGGPVYQMNPSGLLVFIYGPPWAILWAPISLLPLELVCALVLAAQVLALRYVAGSWVAAGLYCWLPVVSGELTTGNVDLLMAAAILAGIRGRTWPVVLFAFAKIAPAFVLIRASPRGWKQAIATGFVLVALTLPWLELWPQWVALMLAVPPGIESVVPVLVRIPLALVLGGIPRPWALAAAAGLLTPSFHAHTWVVMIPAVRLLWDARPLWMSLPAAQTRASSRAPGSGARNAA